MENIALDLEVRTEFVFGTGVGRQMKKKKCSFFTVELGQNSC